MASGPWDPTQPYDTSDGASAAGCSSSEGPRKRVDFAPVLALAGTTSRRSPPKQAARVEPEHGGALQLKLAPARRPLKESRRSPRSSTSMSATASSRALHGTGYVADAHRPARIPLVSANTRSVTSNVFRSATATDQHRYCDSDFPEDAEPRGVGHSAFGSR